jgi:hypothetical protein
VAKEGLETMAGSRRMRKELSMARMFGVMKPVRHDCHLYIATMCTKKLVDYVHNMQGLLLNVLAYLDPKESQELLCPEQTLTLPTQWSLQVGQQSIR